MRTNIDTAAYLQDASYPAGKQDLIDHARREGAGEELVALLGRLPEHRFDTPEEVQRLLDRTVPKRMESGPR